MSKDKKFKFEIINVVGTISKGTSGWSKQLTRVSWSGNVPKYDIRVWSPDHKKMGKGVTLTAEELIQLNKILDEEVALLKEFT